ncbi:MAG: CBS domain-containing protein [Sandaracinaceae bacterium]|nr:MAG: CBS domain-containing protein [Sandaracinaceae bacterium]
MNAKVSDVMAKRVITAEPHHTVDHVRGLMQRNKISAVPVVGPSGEAVGIVTSTDLVAEHPGGAHISQLMTEGVRAVPAYNDASVAARIMRKQKLHHVVVTHEKKVVGIVSAFDLLKLVEDHRFVMKSGPTPSKKAKGSRKGSAA